MSTATMIQPVVDEVQTALAKIEAYRFSEVREKVLMDERLEPEVVDEAISEFRKYLGLTARGYSGLGMISDEVDEVWHTFILFTRAYARFCDDVFGFFLHHQPGLATQPLGPEPRRRFVEAYQEVYGEIPSIWRSKEQCFSTCDTPSTACQESKCK